MDDDIEIFMSLCLVFNMYLMYMKHMNRRRGIIKAQIQLLQQQANANQALITHYMRRRRRRISQNRTCWVHPELKTLGHGMFWEVTVPKYTERRFQEKFRLTRPTFYTLCTALTPYLFKMDTIMRPAIPIEKRVAIALTVLKGNIDFWSIADIFGIGKSTVGKILYEFCASLVQHFYNDKIRFPSTEDEREIFSHGFLEKWQFPGVFGAMDGTHIPIWAPAENAQDYYNYKSFHSFIILGIVDHNYKFIYANVGRPGRCNDASVFRRSTLFRRFTDNEPELRTGKHIISDAAFPLLTWLMKPYPIRNAMPLKEFNFNYRLSSARMAVENSFGRLKGRWRILLKTADHSLENMKLVAKACLVLHNICEESREPLDEEWRQGTGHVKEPHENRADANVADDDINVPMEGKLKRDMLSEALLVDGYSVH